MTARRYLQDPRLRRTEYVCSACSRPLCLFCGSVRRATSRRRDAPTPLPSLRSTHGGLSAPYRRLERWCWESPDGGGGTTRSAVFHTSRQLCHNGLHLKRGSSA